MVSKFQWKPFWLATQRDPQNDWTATQNRVNYDVFAQAPFLDGSFIRLVVNGFTEIKDTKMRKSTFRDHGSIQGLGTEI